MKPRVWLAVWGLLFAQGGCALGDPAVIAGAPTAGAAVAEPDSPPPSVQDSSATDDHAETDDSANSSAADGVAAEDGGPGGPDAAALLDAIMGADGTGKMDGVAMEAGDSQRPDALAPSDAASVTPPAAPTNLSESISNQTVKLKWSASTSATSYSVCRSTTSGGPYSCIASVTTTSYTDASVTHGTTYYYVVNASNNSGSSPWSKQVTAKP